VAIVTGRAGVKSGLTEPTILLSNVDLTYAFLETKLGASADQRRRDGA
jgi:hypothetical protein